MTNDCNCSQALSLTAEVERLTARVAEVEAERDAAQRDAAFARDNSRRYQEHKNEMSVERGKAWERAHAVEAERDALQAAIADTPERRRSLLSVAFGPDAGNPLGYEARLERIGHILSFLRSRAAVTPGSGGGLGGGG
jgi:multidrug resistance efflux pump